MTVPCKSLILHPHSPRPTVHHSVNEIFDPDKVDEFYHLPSETQKDILHNNKATNYGVVRSELLDRLYELMYHQRLDEPDESKWQYKIVPRRAVVGHEKRENGQVRLQLRNTINGTVGLSERSFDLVMVATGYERNAHETMLKSTEDILETSKFDVGRDYRIKYRKDAVADNCGIWLQGCCQNSHGVSSTTSCLCRLLTVPTVQLSDTLLSILAVRGGELVDSIFPQANGANGHS